MGAEGSRIEPGERIDSWKEIAAFFGRDERTVKRWEGRRGLPVYRAPGGGKTSVYAYVGELEDWLKSGASALEEPVLTESAAAQSSILNPAPAGEIESQPMADGSRLPRRRLTGITLKIVYAVLAVCSLTIIWFIASGAPRQDLPREHNPNARAYNFYLKGLYSWQTRTPAGLNQAVADFISALKADPQDAEAYAGLADCYDLMPEFADMRADVAFPKAQQAAERAIALDDRLADAHRALAFTDFWWFHNVTGAMHEFRRAIELDPHSAQTHHWYANVLGMIGNSRDALREIGLAENSEPDSTAIVADRGLLLADSGRLQESIQVLKQVETAQPGFAPAHAYLATAYSFMSNGPAALIESRWHAQLRLDPVELAIAAAGEQGYAVGGWREMNRRMALTEEPLVEKGEYSPYRLALNYAALGERDRVLALLNTAIARRDTYALGMRIEPALQPLHADPRFITLLAREGLPPLSGS